MSLPQNTTLTPLTIHCLTIHIPLPYETVLQRFRTLAPPLQPGILRTQSSAEAIAQVIDDTNTTSGFVRFAEFNHGSWVHHFLSPEQGGRQIHRFIFGNPILAAAMIQESIYAAVHVPLDCGFVEEVDGSTTMVMVLPGGLVEGDGDADAERMGRAVGEVEGRVFRLVDRLQEDGV
ncbi:hypothetical protein BO94DRAFT_567403 [Aspergillus sclerotioniger CBS 115572]|uniref:DUF302 domain-containing protein n=1 Tax=Aspergillus sclerotioniger CBS 115572 TaxID=1450535 RepID=A0A317W458_9EURO|nr:hypothetical protein BO94DRAFT_567403 [Aspergillus sclerotioniger CBS 115572]PWY80795.1 hypothetical protein BO94DRAFT_567403 [Aspergillus sclerotioniger CBS 115572]